MRGMDDVILDHRFTRTGHCACGAVIREMDPALIARHVAGALAAEGFRYVGLSAACERVNIKAVKLAALMAEELTRQAQSDSFGPGYVGVEITVDADGLVAVDPGIIDGYFDLVKLAEVVITEVRSEHE